MCEKTTVGSTRSNSQECPIVGKAIKAFLWKWQEFFENVFGAFTYFRAKKIYVCATILMTCFNTSQTYNRTWPTLVIKQATHTFYKISDILIMRHVAHACHNTCHTVL